MTDMLLITGAITSIKAASDIAKSLMGVRDATMIQSKVIELQSVILSAQSSALNAQSEQFSLLNRISALEKEVADLKAWDAQREQYELVQIGNGCVAYMRKPQADAPEQPAWLCATCYENRKKSHLQFQTTFHGGSVYHCSSCNSKLAVPRGATQENFRQ